MLNGLNTIVEIILSIVATTSPFAEAVESG